MCNGAPRPGLKHTLKHLVFNSHTLAWDRGLVAPMCVVNSTGGRHPWGGEGVLSLCDANPWTKSGPKLILHGAHYIYIAAPLTAYMGWLVQNFLSSFLALMRCQEELRRNAHGGWEGATQSSLGRHEEIVQIHPNQAQPPHVSNQGNCPRDNFEMPMALMHT